MAQDIYHEENIHLLDGSIREGELINFFNAGFDSGKVVEIDGRHHYVVHNFEHDQEGRVIRDWHEELPGYENYP